MEEGRCGLEPPRNPMALCANWSTRASWSFSPPVPALVCSLSPVRHCKQLHGRLDHGEPCLPALLRFVVEGQANLFDAGGEMRVGVAQLT